MYATLPTACRTDPVSFICFVNLMELTKDHMEAPEVMRMAGITSPTILDMKDLQLEDSQKAELDRMAAEMEQWRAERQAEIER
jgi:hypothetical protein